MKKSYVIAIIVILLIGSISYAAPAIINQFMSLDPPTQLLYALSETAKADKVHSISSMEMELDQISAEEQGVFDLYENPEAMIQYVNSILTGVKIETVSTQAKNDLIYTAHSTIAYKNKPFLNIGTYFNKNHLAFSMPELSEKVFKLGSAVSDETLDLTKYRDILTLEDDALYKNAKNNMTPYLDHLNAFLETHLVELEDETLNMSYNSESKDYKTDVLALQFQSSDLNTLIGNLIATLKEDTEVKALIENRIHLLVETFVDSGDYVHLYMTSEEAQAMQAELESEFDTGFDAFLTEVADVLSMPSTLDSPALDPSMEIVFKIDSNSMIRETIYTTLSGFIKTTQTHSFLAYDDAVLIAPITTNDSEDIVTFFQDERKMESFMNELMENLYGNILSGDAYTTLMEDLKVNTDLLPESQREEMLNSIDGLMENIQMIPFLFMGL